jgi:hypothetical protein
VAREGVLDTVVVGVGDATDGDADGLESGMGQ